MKEETHDRAHELVTRSSVEGLTEAESVWLQAHLAGCGDCAQYAEAAAGARQALRSVPFQVSPGLVALTQMRTRMRARELREREQRLLPVWIACIAALAVGAVSTPYLWEGFAWAGARFDLPMAVTGTGFAAFWFMPAVLAAAVMLMARGQRHEAE